MTQYEIYFHGLICFYANEGRFGARDYKTEALIVEDGDHIRKVKTHNSETANFRTIRTNLPAGRVDASDSSFQDFIPHIADTGVSRTSIVVNPQRAIRLALPNDARAYVAELYKYQGVFELDGLTYEHPVCRISLLTIDADELRIITDVGEIIVPPGQPWVAILNYASHKAEDHGAAKNHFHRYARITNGRLEDVAEVTDDDKSNVTDLPNGYWVQSIKDLPELTGIVTIGQTQCSNTNWP